MADSKTRTTLTLPTAAMREAEQIAAERQVTLSTVVGEALREGLAARARARRADEVLAAYRVAFGGFNEEERAILDGVEWEPAVEPGG